MEPIAKPQQRKSAIFMKAVEFIGLLLTVALFILKVALCLVIWWGNPSLLLTDVRLPEALQNGSYKLNIAPNNWVHALWPFLFLWEAVWIIFSWSFICRSAKHHTIFFGVYPAFWLVCLLAIAWGASWGRLFPELGLVFGGLHSASLILCISMASVYLYFIADDLKYSIKRTLWITRILVLNIFAAYAAWSVVLTLFNLGSVLQYNAQLHPDTTSTVVLSLLGSVTITYFLLECTILDQFLRCVFTVYPVVVWSLAAVLVDKWKGGGHRNELFSLILACVCGALSVLRIVLILVFWRVRRMGEYEKEEEEKVPV